ncbi:hypothetical protein [Nocardioides sp. LS1]|uniref:hypothetical protein n=1 Tax=Nocardioides sp. LS1 TaxID=1027620 RepID=UPI000F618239|nr:hypothetical protein [Nocardioides sp. LS1]GCD90573.1 hypothetical protein NLS1_25790 [Nocardioides sp. LS1]
MLPRFEIVGRRRPVDLVSPGSALVDATTAGAVEWATPHPAPYAAVVATGPPTSGTLSLSLAGGDVRLSGEYDAARGAVGLTVRAGGATTTHASRRSGRATAPVEGVALALTGTHLTVLTHEAGAWLARGRVDLAERCDTRDEAWLASLVTAVDGPVAHLTAGGFGQLGLRDVRLVTREDGSPVRDGDDLLLSATSAGPGFFDTAHTSLWRLSSALDLTHVSDLFFRRPDRPGVFGDHATHVVRREDDWLVATSTWGDFDRRRPGASVAITLATTRADLLAGRHVLDTRPLAVPTTGLRSVGVWDPHLVRIGDTWHVGFVSAPKFFRFHPALAAGPSLDELTLVGADTGRIATEGTTLVRLDDGWRVLASDGRDGRRGQRRGYPVYDLALAEVGGLDAPYPTNIPWPTLVREDDGWLMVGFNGAPYGGRLVGYGSHGDVVLMRTSPADRIGIPAGHD